MLGGPGFEQPGRARLESMSGSGKGANLGLKSATQGACDGALARNMSKIKETYVRQEYYYLVFYLWALQFANP